MSKSSPKEYLVSKGWRFIRKRHSPEGNFYFLWDHNDHQHHSHGMFTQTAAVEHQKKSDSDGCNCTKRVPSPVRIVKGEQNAL